MIDCGLRSLSQQSINDQEDDGAGGGDENSTEVERLNLPEPYEAAQKTADDRAGDADEDRNDNPAWGVDSSCGLRQGGRDRLLESNGYNHRDQFSERIGFHFLHHARSVFLDSANCNS